MANNSPRAHNCLTPESVLLDCWAVLPTSTLWSYQMGTVYEGLHETEVLPKWLPQAYTALLVIVL